MAVREYAINITETNFPLLSTQQPSTIITNNGGEVDPSVPAIAYCHNVMPTESGYNSTEVTEAIPDIDILDAGEQIITYRFVNSIDRNRFTIAFSSRNLAYLLDTSTSTWSQLPQLIPDPVPEPDPPVIDRTRLVTTGTVNGITYVYLDSYGCFTFNEATPAFEDVTLDGLTAEAVLSIVSSGGYLCAITEDSVAWSSTIDPTDFVPSDITGAGGGSLQEIKGKALFCTPNATGFLVHTEGNIVSATLTSSAAFPFKFKSVVGSKGSTKLARVTYEADFPEQFVYTKAGLQSVTNTQAVSILPQVTDYLAGKIYEDFDDTYLRFNYTNLVTSNLEMKVALSFVSSRYLVISYGVGVEALEYPVYEYALIYDTLIQRVGKVKYSHSEVMELDDGQEAPANNSIAFMKATGSVGLLDFSVEANSNGTIILGKLQFSRERQIRLQGVEVTNVAIGDDVTVRDMYSFDGKSFITSDPLYKVTPAVEGLSKYAALIDGQVHNIYLNGKFNLTNVIAKYLVTGRS